MYLYNETIKHQSNSSDLLHLIFIINRKFTEQVDEPNTVSCQEASELAHLYDASCVENSSLTGEQVSEVVKTAIRKVAYLRKINSRCRCRRGCFKWIKCKQHK